MPQPPEAQEVAEPRFSLIWDEPLRKAMQALATEHDRSLAGEVRQALREYVERSRNGKDV